MRYALLLLIVFTLNIFASQAQIDNQLGIELGFDVSYRAYFPRSTVIKDLPKANFRVGLTYLHPVRDYLHLKTGLKFGSVSSAGEKRKDIVWPSELPTSLGGTGMIDPSLPHELQFVRRHWFLEVPLLLRKTLKENSRCYWLAGISNHVYLGTNAIEKTDIYTRRESIYNTYIRRFHLVAQFAVGWQWPVRKGRQQITLEPVVRYHLTRLNKEGFAREYPYSAGIQAGFWW